MAIGFEIFPSMYLLPKNKRAFVQVAQNESLVWGDMDKIVERLKQIVTGFKCQTGQGCRVCRNVGKWGPYCGVNILADGDKKKKPPSMQLSLSSCYSGGSSFHGTVLIAAPWGDLEDLRQILDEAGLNRIKFLQVLSGNQLSLVLGNKSQLSALEMGERALWKGSRPDKSFVKTFVQSLYFNNSLHCLSLHKNFVPDGLMARILSSMNKKVALEQLDLSENFSGPKSLDILRELLNDDKTKLKELDLSNQRSAQLDLSPFATALKHNESLESLDLSENDLDRRGLKLLSVAMSMNVSLRSLSLRSQRTDKTCLYLNGLKNLFSAFGSWQGLTSLDISNNLVSREVLSVLARGLRDNRNLQTLKAQRMRPSGSDDRLWYDFAHAIGDNSALKTLDISYTNLDRETVRCLAESLRKNYSLERLGLNGCSITNDGAKALAACLPYTHNIRELCLSENDFDEVGSKAILEGLKEGNRTLLSIEMFDRAAGCSGVVGSTSYSVGRYKKDYADMNLFLKANHYSRTLVHSPITPNLWPLVLQKASNETFNPIYHSPDWLHEPDSGEFYCDWSEDLEEYDKGLDASLVYCLLKRGCVFA